MSNLAAIKVLALLNYTYLNYAQLILYLTLPDLLT